MFGSGGAHQQTEKSSIMPTNTTAPRRPMNLTKRTMHTGMLSAVLLTSALALGCTSDTPLSPVTTMRSTVAWTSALPEQHVLSGTSNYDNGIHHVAFATQAGSSWDDIRITSGTAVIGESFDNDSWDPANFELSDPLIPGSASGGAYRSTGSARGLLRTVAQFRPTAETPLTVEATFRSRTDGEDLSSLAWRSSGLLSSAGAEPWSSVFLRIHNFNEGETMMFNAATATGERPLSQFGNDFYRQGAVRIVIQDNGTSVTATFTRIPEVVTPPVTPITTSGFRAPVSMTATNIATGGSSVPLKFQLKRGDEIISDLFEVASFAATSVTCEQSMEGNQEVLANDALPTGLRYDAESEQFILVWRTPRESGCYVARVTLVNGTSIEARFGLKR
jgi:hypothetical protein